VRVVDFEGQMCNHSSLSHCILPEARCRGNSKLGVILLVMFGVEAEPGSLRGGLLYCAAARGSGACKSDMACSSCQDAPESNMEIPTRSAEVAASRLLRVMM
jgi:hypothetical protein